MKNEDLTLANRLNKEIRELDLFIFNAERVWTGKVIKRESKYIFKTNPYGAFSSEEFEMNTTIKNRVLDVLKEYLKELKEQLASI
jgi:hypothetical protein